MKAKIKKQLSGIFFLTSVIGGGLILKYFGYDLYIWSYGALAELIYTIYLLNTIKKLQVELGEKDDKWDKNSTLLILQTVFFVLVIGLQVLEAIGVMQEGMMTYSQMAVVFLLMIAVITKIDWKLDILKTRKVFKLK